MAKSKQFKFHGGVSSYFGVGIISFFLTVLTAGIAYPWALCMRQRWKTNNTSINGQRLQFTGSGFGLIGLWIKWMFFSLITLGIYMLWIGPSLEKWIVEHTEFV